MDGDAPVIATLLSVALFAQTPAEEVTGYVSQGIFDYYFPN